MQRYVRETNHLVRLATPVLIASVAQTGMGFVDTVMAGGVSATDMAAVSIAASIWLPSILFGIGVLMALIPVVAQLNGSGRIEKIAPEIQQGVYLSLLLAIPIGLVLIQTPKILSFMDVDVAMSQITSGYIDAVIWAIPAFLLFQNFRSYTDGMSLTKPAMVIGFVGLLLNIPLNYILVYGKLGLPALGGVGCGVATTIVYWVMFSLMVGYVAKAKKLQKIGLFERWYAPNWKEQWRLFTLGLPVALAMFFEVTLFAVVAILVAPLGPIVVASHQVAINFSSMIFMLPMSIGAAVSIRVGHKLGEKSTDGAKVSTRVGLIAGLATAVVTALFTVFYREQIALLYTDNTEVIVLAGHLLLLAAIYQCTDSIQVIAAGALRGYKDMRSIFVITFFAYWCVGLPLGYVLGRTDLLVPALGAEGFWYGFIAGLSTAALLLFMRIRWMHKQSDHVQFRFANR
jgi:MATE family multidrug resistance protein